MPEARRNPEPPPHLPTEREERRRSFLSNIIVIIGFIVIAIIVLWGFISLARITISWMDRFFERSGSAVIEVSAPRNAVSGEVFTVSWQHEPKEVGTYGFLYDCVEGLQLGAPGPENMFAGIPCATAVTLGPATSSIAILPILSASSSANASISILFIPSASAGAPAEARGSTIVTVNHRVGEAPPESSPPSPTPRPQTPAQQPSAPASPADLSVTIISATADAYGNGSLVFRIANIGGRTSGSYTFSASLPMAQPYTYASTQQSPLSPGSGVVNTLHFTQAVSGTISVSVTGGDSRTGNNTASQQLYVPYVSHPYPGYPPTTGGPYYAPQPQPYTPPTYNPYPYQYAY